MNCRIAHLHLHSQYSLLDGANKIDEILKLAHSKGQPAIAITDHGTMHGVIEFFMEAKKIGIKPILGCELYVNQTSRFERKTEKQGGAGANHLTVLAKDITGYHNLCRLVTLAYREGFYFKPRVDHELLTKYSEGLIALSGCLAGELSDYTSIDDYKKSIKVAEFYAQTFKNNYYIEVQPHQIKEQQKHNSACLEIANKLGLPMVVTNDCHYPTPDHHHAQEVLMCISTGKKITDPDRLKHDGLKLHLKDASEILDEMQGFSRIDEAIKNTVSIAECCNLEFETGKYYMPKYPVEKEQTLDQLMAQKAREGLEQRVEVLSQRNKNWDSSKIQIYKDRLEEEIKLIWKMGFSGYFLVVGDFIVWAKENSVPVGPGRGSAAGSLVAYAMRITDIDPIEHKLLFERFLNPERVSLPDIDVDFCINGRDKVIKYVVEKYGKENVAQIATFGTLKAKGVIKDVGRALGLSFAETDRVAQLVPAPRQGFDFSLEEALKMEKRLADYAENEGKELISLALKLEGLTRHSSTHAAGVVIGDRPLIDLLPLMIDKDGNEITQYTMTYVEKIGLVKFDFLGLKTLTVIHTALKLVKQSRGVELDLDYLPLDDAKTFALLCSGNTTGVFQLESSGITEVTMRLKPSCFDDLTAILALYRPGPLDAGMVDHYIERKHGREPVVYLHPKMKDSLSDTYGIIIYQEQIMQLARELAGYSLGQADLLRRAMGKKNPEEMQKHREIFVKGATARGLEKPKAEQIFDQMETFGRYGFNRSHSAAYALISYQTAYLRAHYDVEFMAALMTQEMVDTDKTLKNLNECREQKIEILPPDINYSLESFSVEDGKIRYGLEAVIGLGQKVASAIIDVRNKNGKYADLEDFATKLNSEGLNKRVLENLIRCGAFDFSAVSRREMFERTEEILRQAQSIAKEQDSNQMSLFGDSDESRTIPKKRLNLAEWPVNRRLSEEKGALGFYISGHPLEKFRKELKRIGVVNTAELNPSLNSSKVKIAGVITALKLKNTKKGERYATFSLEDWLGTVESIVWPDSYKNLHAILVSAEPVVVSGRLDMTEERKALIVEKIESLISIRDRNATQGVLDLDENLQNQTNIGQLLNVFAKHRGNCPVKVRLKTKQKTISLTLKDAKNSPVVVLPSESLCEEVEQIFGKPVLTFV